MVTFALLLPVWSAQPSAARPLSSSSDLVLYVILPVLAAGTSLARLAIGHAHGAVGDVIAAVAVLITAGALLQFRWTRAGLVAAYVAVVLLVGAVVRRLTSVVG